MKKTLKMLIIVGVLLLFSLSASAAEGDEHLEEFGEIIPEGFEELKQNPKSAASLIGFENILSEISLALSERQGRISTFFMTVLGAAAIIAVSSLSEAPALGVTRSGVGLMISAALCSSLLPLFSEMSRSLSEASRFFGALIPLGTAISVSTGAVATASVGAVGMGITLSLVGGAGGSVLLSLSGLSLSFGMLSPLGFRECPSILKGVRSFFFWVLGIVTALLVGSLSLQTVIASAQDSATMRGVKYLASGMIPVVGGTVSGALSTLASGMAYVKGVVGVGSVWVLAIIFLPPLLTLLLYRFALTLAVSITEGVGADGEPFSSLRFALDTLIAVYSLSALIYIFEVILFIKSGVSP